MHKRILITGATGALGSLLLPRLLDQGHQVLCLVHTAPLAGHIRSIAGDIRKPHCGIPSGDLHELAGSIDTIVHCAATVGFSDEQTAWETNVIGLYNVVTLAQSLGVKEFHHVSTAYVSGDAKEFPHTALCIGQQWRNSYERTKWTGEMLIRSWLGQNPQHRFTVYRPSILVGCEDGTTPSFTGYYGFFRPIHAVLTELRARAAAGQTLPADVRVADGNIVHMPLVIHASLSSTLNLTPIDWAADRMADLIARPVYDQTHNLVHPHPPRVHWVIETSLRKLGLAGATIVETAEDKKVAQLGQSKRMAQLQRQIDRVLQYYMPYVTTEPFFGNPDELLQTMPAPRPITEEFLSRLLDYAISVNWGAGGAQ